MKKSFGTATEVYPRRIVRIQWIEESVKLSREYLYPTDRDLQILILSLTDNGIGYTISFPYKNRRRK